MIAVLDTDHFTEFPIALRQIGTMDLKIASICIAHDMTLLSRNQVHFSKVPG